MRVVHWGRAREFSEEHKKALNPLKQWRRAVQAANWRNFADLHATFADADWVDGKMIFKIKGNDYRLIAIAEFDNETVYIRYVMTHEQYDKGIWKKDTSKKTDQTRKNKLTEK